MEIVVRIRTDFPAKFGLPRQSGLVDALKGVVVFEPGYRDPNALRGLEGFSHLWLIWRFSETADQGWSPTVRPPRLGGNRAMGVFATRSPFRPNPIGLSCVRLERIERDTPEGPRLIVAGPDLMDGTPIYDIKPYVPHTDCRPEATGGFSDRVRDYALTVTFPPELLRKIPEDRREALIGALAQDPRPGYRRDDPRRFGFRFAGMEIGFRVRDGALTVTDVTEA